MFMHVGNSAASEWGMMKELLTRACSQDSDADGGRESFVHQPFPTLPFTFCWEEKPGLSYMTNCSACLTESVENETRVQGWSVCVSIHGLAWNLFLSHETCSCKTAISME